MLHVVDKSLSDSLSSTARVCILHVCADRAALSALQSAWGTTTSTFSVYLYSPQSFSCVLSYKCYTFCLFVSFVQNHICKSQEVHFDLVVVVLVDLYKELCIRRRIESHY